MRNRMLMVLVAISCILSTIPIASRLPGDFIPKDDQSEFIVSLRAAEGTPIHQTAEYLAAVERELQKWPEVRLVLSTIGESTGSGVNEGQLYVGLSGIHERKKSQFILMDDTRKVVQELYPQMQSSVTIVPLISGGGIKQVDVNLSLQGPDLDALKNIGIQLMEQAKSMNGLVDLELSTKPGKPEIRVEVDRTRAASLGVDMQDLATTLRMLVGGDEVDITRYKDPLREEEYEVRIRVQKDFRQDLEAVKNLFVKAEKGWLPLHSIANVIFDEGPTQIDRYSRQRQVSVYANLRGLALSDAQNQLETILGKLEIPAGISYKFLGNGKLMAEQQAGFMVAFLLSAIFVYMILGAQFESFIHPVTILVALPLCIPFGLLSLLIGNESLNLYSTLGLFMLFGIVKKNSILQVDYSNQLVSEGMERFQAAYEANRTRLKPILMTTVTLIAGMLPMAFGDGPGSGSRRGMATVIIGGQTLSLLITLLVTPVIWSLFEDAKEYFGKKPSKDGKNPVTLRPLSEFP